jgi:hypothetical protein
MNNSLLWEFVHILAHGSYYTLFGQGLGRSCKLNRFEMLIAPRPYFSPSIQMLFPFRSTYYEKITPFLSIESEK